MRLIGKVILLLVLTFIVLVAQDEVRLDLQINLFMKILKYDRNISQRGAEGLKMGLLYNPAVKKSVRTKEDFEKKFNELQEKQIKNITLLLIPIKGYNELSNAISNYDINLLYITSGFDNKLVSILDKCKTEKILTLTGYPEYAEQGTTIGLGIKDDKPEIIINTIVAKEIGADFSADILKLARVIK